jgi:hypothetical protein
MGEILSLSFQLAGRMTPGRGITCAGGKKTVKSSAFLTLCRGLPGNYLTFLNWLTSELVRRDFTGFPGKSVGKAYTFDRSPSAQRNQKRLHKLFNNNCLNMS